MSESKLPIVKPLVRVSSKRSVREAGELSSDLMERQASEEDRPETHMARPYLNSLQMLEVS